MDTPNYPVANHYLLLYEVVDNYIERRAPLRAAHYGLLKEARERGELVLAGAFAEPTDGAALVFRTNDPAVVDRFVANDPYVKSGLVRAWRVIRWQVVVAENL
jgi:uncharacterized protein YciI